MGTYIYRDRTNGEFFDKLNEGRYNTMVKEAPHDQYTTDDMQDFKLSEKPESIKILEECIKLQITKSHDYQNPNSSIKQAMHYRRGVDSIHDMIHQKVLRAQSLLEAGVKPSNESLEDTYKDIINYCSFAVSYLRGKMDGQ